MAERIEPAWLVGVRRFHWLDTDAPYDPFPDEEPAAPKNNASLFFVYAPNSGVFLDAEAWRDDDTRSLNEVVDGFAERAQIVASMRGLPPPQELVCNHESLHVLVTEKSQSTTPKGPAATLDLEAFSAIAAIIDGLCHADLLAAAVPPPADNPQDRALVLGLFKEAAAVAALAPWKTLGDLGAVGIHYADHDIGQGVVAMLNNDEDIRGFALFPSIRAIELLQSFGDSALEDIDGYWLTFESLENISPARLRALARLEAPLLDNAHYPLALRINEGQAMALDSDDLALMVATCRALRTFFQDHGQHLDDTDPQSLDAPLQSTMEIEMDAGGQWSIQVQFPPAEEEEVWDERQDSYAEAINLSVEIFETLCALHGFDAAPPKTFTFDDAIWVIVKALEMMLERYGTDFAEYGLGDFELDCERLVEQFETAGHRAAALELLDEVYEHLLHIDALNPSCAKAISAFVRSEEFRKRLLE